MTGVTVGMGTVVLDSDGFFSHGFSIAFLKGNRRGMYPSLRLRAQWRLSWFLSLSSIDGGLYPGGMLDIVV